MRLEIMKSLLLVALGIGLINATIVFDLNPRHPDGTVTVNGTNKTIIWVGSMYFWLIIFTMKLCFALLIYIDIQIYFIHRYL